ncbi:MAG: DUF4411 family protein [Sphingomicrobium sp.]
MLYLIDANVLITAHNLYYPVDAVPEFWGWVAYRSEKGAIKMPLEIFEEVKDGSTDEEKDHLYAWISDEQHKASLILEEEVDPGIVAEVVSKGYAPDLTDQELEQIGRDPFLIAYALAAKDERIVVTTESSASKKQRQNRRIPDVCATFGVNCCDPFAMLKALKFSTGWKPE